MSRRVLKRPKHGWARTRQERFDDALNSGIVSCIGICFMAASSISIFGTTVVLVENVVAWFG
jgi:hypothetical protein